MRHLCIPEHSNAAIERCSRYVLEEDQKGLVVLNNTMRSAGKGAIQTVERAAAKIWDMLGGMGLPAKDRELVQIVDAALADVARRAGEWLVCRVGCTQCCYGAFAIDALDVLRLKAGMEALRGAEPDLAAEIERRARAWIEEHGAEFPGDLATGVLGETEADHERFEQFANEAACPALDESTGRCDVYAWRPMTCRVFGPPIRMDGVMGDGQALGHCELCFHGASEADVKACEMTVPNELEEALLEEVGKQGQTVVAFALLP